MSERLLTASEVAEFLAVKESWVREATRDGRSPPPPAWALPPLPA